MNKKSNGGRANNPVVNNKKRKKSKKKGSFILNLILIVSICVFIFAGYKLITIMRAYQKSDNEYNNLRSTYVTETVKAGGTTGNIAQAADKEGIAAETLKYEDAEVPLNVDFEALKEINPDIVGWLYIEAIPEISYPICRGTDNDFYLHRTFEKQQLFSGSIFESFENAPDLTDSHTIIYGHNMKNRSMFGRLKEFKESSAYETSPYFWIITPEGNYRYHIFSVMDTRYDSDVYTMFSGPGDEFLKWEEKVKSGSMYENDVELFSDDKTVTLSTCTSNSSVRFVVVGKCVSSERPVK